LARDSSRSSSSMGYRPEGKLSAAPIAWRQPCACPRAGESAI
jgi:hypothetical protein